MPSIQTAPPSLVGLFLQWYFLQVPAEDLRRFLGMSQALRNVISVAFLLRTLFARWKGISEDYPQQGFAVTKILQACCLNLTSRCIGAGIRLIVILLGLFVQFFLLVAFILREALWIALPVLMLCGVGYLFAAPFI